ncbi:hypothetical protein H5410_012284 [Solanum commersonii]|uniref:Uncharacterized protein n=1 Tax=Solanum commersonii TaxID=4109 RepID=A0A9J6AS71_SOLCO|nr:hypothetical protein H5410_012284 [Solanum commersonii]
MKFSDMKLQAMNAVRAYFVRNWTIEDLMNSGEMTQHDYASLKRVYLTLLFAMWSFTSGSFSHWIWEVGGQFTVLSSVASLLCLYLISPLRVRTRVLLLMIAAFSNGASIGIFTKYFFKIDQDLVVSLLAPPTLGIGSIWSESLLTRERSEIYLACLFYSWAVMFSTFVATKSEFIDSQTAQWMLKVCIVFALFMGYVVVYSQEILYDAHFGEINSVNRTLTAFFRYRALNAVRAYFVRNWTIEDLMNNGEIPQHAYTSLKRVYLTLFFAMWSFTFGSFLHWTRGAGGLFTVLSSVASLLCLYFISPLRVRTRVLLLMIAAFSIGASIGIFIKYFFDIDHDLVYILLAPPTFSIGFMWFGSMFTRERSDIYLGCLYYSWALCFSTFVASNADYIDSQTSHFLLKVCIVLALFLGYVVVYSQEILYDAHYGEINFVNRTLTIFFRLPDMKLQARKVVRAYFVRNWTREDLMNNGEIPEQAYASLKTFNGSKCIQASKMYSFHIILDGGIYLFHVISGVSYSLMCLVELFFWIFLAIDLGSGREVHSPFFCSKFTLSLLYITIESVASYVVNLRSMQRTRVSLLMFAACNMGASFGLYVEYLFGMNQIHVVGLYAGPTLAIGTFWIESLLSRERREIYINCLSYPLSLMFATCVVRTFEFIDRHATYGMLKVCVVLALFLGYVVVYSQEILYDAHFGEINFVNHTLTIFFHLPGIVVHAARLCLGAKIEQHRQN